MNSLGRLIQSFSNAISGLVFAVRKEQNLRLEILAGLFVLLTMMILPLKRWEMVVLLLAIFWVIILEVYNSFLERLINLLKPRLHPQVKILKDIMAAVVFLAALAAATVGAVIFWPYIFF